MINIEDYINLGGKEFIFDSIVSFLPSISESDFEFGTIKRYFIQKLNDTNIIEIDQQTYTSYLNNNYYITVELDWKITGTKNSTFDSNGVMKSFGVIEYNTRSLSEASKTIPNISEKITNLTQFWRGF